MHELDRLADKLVRNITETYRDIETKLIYEIATIFREYQNISDVQEFIDRLDELGIINEKTIGVISELTGKPINEIVKSIETLGYKSVDTSTLNEINKLDIVDQTLETIQYKPIVDFRIKRMKEEMEQVQNNVKVGLYRNTYKSIRYAQLSVELGVESPNTAIAKTIKQLAKDGITGDTYLRKGKEVHQNMESVVRRAVRTSFTNVMADVNEQLGEDLGSDSWLMSQHLGARTTDSGFKNHAEWQGKIYSTEELTTVCGKDHPQGYLGYNCRHIARPYIKGISVEPEPLLDMEELERVYALEQKQRHYERTIRESKRIIESLKILDTEEARELLAKENKLLKQRQKRIREYIKENSDVLRRDYSRERIYTNN